MEAIVRALRDTANEINTEEPRAQIADPNWGNGVSVNIERADGSPLHEAIYLYRTSSIRLTIPERLFVWKFNILGFRRVNRAEYLRRKSAFLDIVERDETILNRCGLNNLTYENRSTSRIHIIGSTPLNEHSTPQEIAQSFFQFRERTEEIRNHIINIFN